MSRFAVRTLALCSLAASAWAAEQPKTDMSFCQNLDTWAASIPLGTSSTVRLGRTGVWLVNHAKECKFAETDPASRTFCAWLMEHSSTEFMESNINRALACLQGQQILGYSGNTGIRSWSGKATFYDPHLETENSTVELEFAVDNSHEGGEQFLQVTVMRRDSMAKP